MILRRFLLVLVFSLHILLVAFVVLMSGFGLASAAEDATGARALWWVAMGLLMLIVTNLILLVLALGLHVLQSGPSPSGRRREGELEGGEREF